MPHLLRQCRAAAPASCGQVRGHRDPALHDLAARRWLPQFTFAQTLAALSKLHLTPKERAMMAHLNARTLLGVAH